MNTKTSLENPESNELGSETPISDEALNEVHGGRKLSLGEKVIIGEGLLNPFSGVMMNLIADEKMPGGAKKLWAAVFDDGDFPDELGS